MQGAECGLAGLLWRAEHLFRVEQPTRVVDLESVLQERGLGWQQPVRFASLWIAQRLFDEGAWECRPARPAFGILVFDRLLMSPASPSGGHGSRILRSKGPASSSRLWWSMPS